MSHRQRFHSKPSGFTLIELLVVISIIGVLVALLLPSLSQARYRAREVQCMANLRALITSSYNYSGDNKGDVPYAGFETYGRGCFDADTRMDLFDNYGLANPRAWWCPLAYFCPPAVTKTLVAAQNIRWYNDPTYTILGWQENHKVQNGYMYFLGPSRGFTGTAATTYSMPIYKRFSDIRAPSTRTAWNDNIKTVGTQFGGVSGVWQHPCNTHDLGNAGYPDGAYHAMADGHVEYRKYYTGVNVFNWISQYFIY